MFVAAFLLAQVLPVVPIATPAPLPSPGKPRRFHVDLEAGGSNSYLNHGKGRWESGYFGTTFDTPSGIKVHLNALNDVRFGNSNDVYAIRTDIPTLRPNGTLDVGYAYSPRNDVLPTRAIFGGYDLRAGGGWGYQFGYAGRSFSSASADSYGFGIDRHWKRQRLGYFVSFSTVSNRTGLGIVQGVRWSTDLPDDTVTLTSSAGRGTESTGRNRVGIRDVFSFDADELHWLDARTGIRLNVGYVSVSPPYQRFFVLMGLRVRVGRII
jgi:YaiO family outer membrane protein